MLAINLESWTTVSWIWVIKLPVVTFEHIRCNVQFDRLANTFSAFARTASKGIHFAFVPGARFLPFFRRWDRTGFIFRRIFILLSLSLSSVLLLSPPHYRVSLIRQRRIHFRPVSRLLSSRFFSSARSFLIEVGANLIREPVAKRRSFRFSKLQIINWKEGWILPSPSSYEWQNNREYLARILNDFNTASDNNNIRSRMWKYTFSYLAHGFNNYFFLISEFLSDFPLVN